MAPAAPHPSGCTPPIVAVFHTLPARQLDSMSACRAGRWYRPAAGGLQHEGGGSHVGRQNSKQQEGEGTHDGCMVQRIRVVHVPRDWSVASMRPLEGVKKNQGSGRGKGASTSHVNVARL